MISSALVAAYLVGPRLGRFDRGDEMMQMGSPTTAILGMFMLWWGWLGFNCGRFNFVAYVIFSAVNTVVYCIPAGWLWAERGFLYQMGILIITSSSNPAFLAAVMVGPRLGRYDHSDAPLPMGSPTTAILGMFMLWWGWLGFNCGR
ncbi:hypothetical protein HAZT_HAZT002185 [Hyalella azteca]|uniref:Ammonium transporter AmtB-like domain-containing protein n=1 Tax=Hyalella azteca TaxID=294128 RepID=A0A6A0GRK1_HYAAZ|nr:hypothetical protein HAZT_HAZT002185 [Hyalella azteca]